MIKEIKRKWLLLIIVTVSGFFLDWLTKYMAEARLNFGEPVRVAGEYLQLLLVYNKGALFGFNPGSLISSFPVNPFFIVFTILAIAMLLLYYRSIPGSEAALHWGIMLVIPGALGNLLDRLIHPGKGVVDFIRIGVSEDMYWPIFNFADIYVTVGIVFMIYAFLTEEKRRKKTVVLSSGSNNKKEKSIIAVSESSVSGNVR